MRLPWNPDKFLNPSHGTCTYCCKMFWFLPMELPVKYMLNDPLSLFACRRIQICAFYSKFLCLGIQVKTERSANVKILLWLDLQELSSSI